MHKITKKIFKEMQVPTPEMAAKDVECWNKYNKYASIVEPEKLGLPMVKMMREKKQESMFTVTLDTSNHILNIWKITTGLVDKTQASPRECFAPAFKDMATSVIFVHNHPSGCTDPSEQDWALTRQLCEAGKILMVPVLDHIIVGKHYFTSLCRRNPEPFEMSCVKM